VRPTPLLLGMVKTFVVGSLVSEWVAVVLEFTL